MKKSVAFRNLFCYADVSWNGKATSKCQDLLSIFPTTNPKRQKMRKRKTNVPHQARYGCLNEAIQGSSSFLVQLAERAYQHSFLY